MDDVSKAVEFMIGMPDPEEGDEVLQEYADTHPDLFDAFERAPRDEVLKKFAERVSADPTLAKIHLARLAYRILDRCIAVTAMQKELADKFGNFYAEVDPAVVFNRES